MVPAALPSAAITGACPAGAVGSGRGATAGRGASRRSVSSRSRRSSRGSAGLTTRVSGRATARRASGFARVAPRAGALVALAAGFAGAATFVAAVRLAAAFAAFSGSAADPGRFALLAGGSAGGALPFTFLAT